MQFNLHWCDGWFPWFGFDRNNENKRMKYKNTYAASWPFTGRLCQPNIAMLKSGKKSCWTLTSFQCLRVSTHCEISTSLLCFKGPCCWFCCYFWPNDWLVGTSLSRTPETGNARGHSHVHSESVLLENRAGSVWRLALPGSSALRAAGLLCPSHTPTHHFLLHPFLPLTISRLGVSVAGGSLTLTALKQTTFRLFDL